MTVIAMPKSFSGRAGKSSPNWDVVDYVYLTNGMQGYLFADVNGDGAADYGIELKELTSLSDFSYMNLLR